MAQTAFSIRMDEGLKRDFGLFCENIGMTMSTAFVVFAKAALRCRKIPFEICDCRIDDSNANVSNRHALEAFERMRAQAQEQLKDKDEPTIDEIDAIISKVRKERRKRRKARVAV